MRALSAQLRDGVRLWEAAGLADLDERNDPTDEHFRAREAFESALDAADKQKAAIGDCLLDGSGMLRLYQIAEDDWKLDDGTYTDRLPCGSAVFFDCWQIFDNVRDDLADLHR